MIKKQVRPSKLKHSAGWISPEGGFFACSSWGHIQLANDLTANIKNKKVAGFIASGEYLLEHRGWVRLYEDGKVYMRYRDDGITQAQADTIFELAKIAKSWREELLWQLRVLEVK